MNKKNLLISIVAILLVIVAIFFISDQSNSTLRGKENNFAINDTASVSKIFLADKSDNQVLLSKNQDGLWMVNDSLEALQEKVHTLLTTMKTIDVQRPVSNKAYNGVVSRLAARSVKVEIYQKAHFINLFNEIKFFPYEKNTRTYYVGGETKDRTGTFMLMEGAERPYIVGIPGFRGFVTTRYTALLADWRHHRIFESRINEIDQLEVSYRENPEESFRIENIENRAFKLYDISQDRYLKQFDTVKVIEYLTSYRNIRFEYLMNNRLRESRIDSIASQQPGHVIELKRQDGSSQRVETHYMPANGQLDYEGNPLPYNPDKMYAFINDGADIVTVQFFVFDKLLKPIGYFTGKHQSGKRSGFIEIN